MANLVQVRMAAVQPNPAQNQVLQNQQEVIPDAVKIGMMTQAHHQRKVLVQMAEAIHHQNLRRQVRAAVNHAQTLVALNKVTVAV